MDRTFIIVAALGLFLSITIQPGYAIKCYQCNSHNETKCASEKPPENLVKDCSSISNDNRKYTLCRKIVQTIEYEVNGLPPDSRVIRSCGWDESSHVNACYQRSGFGGRQEVCSCKTDLCNSASTAGLAGALLLAIFTVHALIVK